eukprot:PhM_4_TR5388/c0_g1_i1/m.8999
MSSLKYFHTVWRRLHDKTPSPSLAESWLARLEAAYSEPQRAYHTTRHIEEMLTLCEESLATTSTTNAIPRHVYLSIYFHDAVYDPIRKDNEDMSAVMFRQYADEIFLAEAEKDLVIKYIMATQHHTNVELEEVAADMWLGYFLDMDLAILASDYAERYVEYTEQVRKEYSHFSDANFRSGRRAFLEAFVKEPRLYKTDFFHEKCDAQSRQNMRNEIASLTTCDARE